MVGSETTLLDALLVFDYIKLQWLVYEATSETTLLEALLVVLKASQWVFGLGSTSETTLLEDLLVFDYIKSTKLVKQAMNGLWSYLIIG